MKLSHIATVLLLLTALLSGCASNRSDDERGGASDAGVSDGTSSNDTDLALEKLESELDSPDGQAASTPAPDAAATTADASTPNEVAPAPTETPLTNPDAVPPANGEVAKNDMQALEQPPSDSAAPSTTVPDNSFAPTTAVPPAVTADQAIEPQAGSAMANQAADAPAAAAIPAPVTDAKKEAATDAAPKAASATPTQVTPDIPAKAFSKKNANMNRYYFVRQGDTSKTIAKLIYGDTKKAKDLVSWNSSSMKAGKIVYYQAPLTPDDQEMKSFFEERNVPPTTYAFKKGDTLAKVAKKQLGSSNSWVEIAFTNKLPSKSAAEVGQNLSIYPKKLTPFGIDSLKQQVAMKSADAPAEEVPGPAATGVPVAGATAPPAPGAPGATPAPAQNLSKADAAAAAAAVKPPPPPEPPPAPAKPKAFNLMQFVTQNIIFIGAVAAIVGLLLVMRMISKKKKRNRLEDKPAGAEPTRVRSR